jgi:uncharacterized protein (TIGR03437 family)
MKSLPALLLAACTLAAQDWRYDLITPSGESPQARVDGTITYHAGTASLYLFGGSAGQTLNDLWAFSFAENAWRRIEPNGGLPPARLGHTLLTDPKRNRLILFGGQARGFFSDVWAYNIADNRWQLLAADNAGPSLRYGHSAVLDPAGDRMIISHGFTNSGRFDDTWSFDLASNQWRNLTPSGTKPLRRCLHHAVLDEAAQTMYLYGGCASGAGPCPLGDLWAFNLRTNTWTEVTPSSRPSPRQHYGFSFDSRRNRIVLHGGSGLSDTWLFDPAARLWSQLPAQGTGPRSRHQGAYAAERGTSYFFGGDSNELWALSSGLPRIAAASKVAPGEYISLYGANLSPDPVLTLNGATIPPVYADANQINLRIPLDLAPATEATLKVNVGAETSNELRLSVVAVNPYLFPVAVNQDGAINSAANPAAPGSIAVFYATGQGTQPLPVVLEINGIASELLYAGGDTLLQVNARIPNVSGPATVKLRVGDAETQSNLLLHVR